MNERLASSPQPLLSEGMASLKTILTTLQGELDAAYSGTLELRDGTRLRTDRISLCVELDLAESPDADGGLQVEFRVPSSDRGKKKNPASPRSTTQGHTLTFEFRRDTGSAVAAPEIQRPQTEESKTKTPLVGTAYDQLVTGLSRVFGQPGFDSSARATVFREILGELSKKHQLAVRAALRSGTFESDERLVHSALHRLRGLFKSGPATSPKVGAELFSAIAGEHSIPSLLQLIQEAWKEQSNWMG